MSEQELKKWGDKLKLWRRLHPDEHPTHHKQCKFCKYGNKGYLGGCNGVPKGELLLILIDQDAKLDVKIKNEFIPGSMIGERKEGTEGTGCGA